ncbi:MAG TPA: hypothetical protein VGR53_06745 [Nitrososphaerales archaeon]|nr:hypothetical protein [Nitrososphaerales archaeon]
MTPEKQFDRGGRVRWQYFNLQERAMLERKFHGDWESLDFLENFWNPIYDQRDLFQYRRTAEVWRIRLSGKAFKEISRELQIDQRKACALVSGKNLHPNLVQMYLNSQMLSKPRIGWKWILECTPKPTNPFPRANSVPATIQTYQDILDFLKQFSPVPPDHPAIKFFGLSNEWVERHKPELFGFLLGFLLGDAGKNYPEYEHRSRRPFKTTLSTNMAISKSNIRVLRFFQLCLASIGIDSHQQKTRQPTIRWVSPGSATLTWILRVCLGLGIGQRTSRNPANMNWLFESPREFIVAFLQGLAESDGHVDKNGRYADIASKVNSIFLVRLLNILEVKAHAYPKSRPKETRMTLRESLKLPLFSPLIKSYRFKSMFRHAFKKGLLPPSPSFFRVNNGLVNTFDIVSKMGSRIAVMVKSDLGHCVR